MEMESIILNAPPQGELTQQQIAAALEKLLEGRSLNKVLLLPPDLTRMHSRAGEITAWLFKRLHGSCRVDVMPALGSHAAMTGEELNMMFGGIPQEAFIAHDWRSGLKTIGCVPGEFIREISGGRLNYDIEVQVNRRLYDGYGLIVSIGQVVPHEVAGMANHSKNIFVGAGGINMIHRTHFLGAVCGMEQALGRDHAPVRRVFDYAAERFLGSLPAVYAMTVIKPEDGRDRMKGLYIGDRRDAFEAAVERSRRDNINWLDKPLKTCVCRMEPEEFRSFWVSNKSIYRTRMAMADGGKLIVLAPAVDKFGEDPGIDRLLRKYGYKGTDYVLKAVRENEDIGCNLSAAAHLIHGSSEGRFEIYYAAPRLCREEIENAGFKYISFDEASRKYAGLKDGFNAVDGEEVYYISNPAMGLWQVQAKR
jgi:nickel-dependent lactate racemase